MPVRDLGLCFCPVLAGQKDCPGGQRAVILDVFLGEEPPLFHTNSSPHGSPGPHLPSLASDRPSALWPSLPCARGSAACGCAQVSPNTLNWLLLSP